MKFGRRSRGQEEKILVGQAVKVSSGTMWNLRIICALCACCTLLLSALLYILTIFVIFMLYFTLMYNMQYNYYYSSRFSPITLKPRLPSPDHIATLMRRTCAVRLCFRDYDNYLLLIIKTAVLKLTPFISIREMSKCYNYFHTFKQKGCY